MSRLPAAAAGRGEERWHRTGRCTGMVGRRRAASAFAARGLMLNDELCEGGFLLWGERAEEAGEYRGVVTAAVEHRAHPGRGEAGLIEDWGVGVPAAGLLA